MSNWKDILNSFQGVHVLVVGDVMLDKYLHGSVDRISPEAPVPILSHQRSEEKLGGAANVAINLRALGCRVSLAGVVGSDPEAIIIREKLKTNNISDHLIQDGSRKTTVKTRLLSGHHHILRVDFEDTFDIDDFISKQLEESINNAIKQDVSLIILQDYNKGVLNSRNIRRFIASAKKNQIPVAVDPKIDNFKEFVGADFIKPNLKEARIAVNEHFEVSEELLKEKAHWIKSQLQATYVMITLSEHGVFSLKEGEHLLSEPTKREIVDVCGAGDAVLAIAPLAFALGHTCSIINQLTNTVGGQVCEEPGVSVINTSRVLDELNSSN